MRSESYSFIWQPNVRMKSLRATGGVSKRVRSIAKRCRIRSAGVRRTVAFRCPAGETGTRCARQRNAAAAPATVGRWIRSRQARRPACKRVPCIVRHSSPINGRAGSPRHDADGRSCPLLSALRTALLRARLLVPVVALLAADAAAQSPPAPAVLDPIVVTASRTPQRLIDLVADVTVIDAQAIAQSGAQGIVALLAAPTRRRNHPERRSRLDIRRLPARREHGADAGADRRHARRVGVERRDGARGHPARADRAHRDPARSRIEPVRRGCDRRRDPGVHAPRRAGRPRRCVGRVRNARIRGPGRPESPEAPAPHGAACRSPAGAATASMRS